MFLSIALEKLVFLYENRREGMKKQSKAPEPKEAPKGEHNPRVAHLTGETDKTRDNNAKQPEQQGAQQYGKHATMPVLISDIHWDPFGRDSRGLEARGPRQR